ncbi:MAG: S8 family serine peptidase [Verrucomicrobia bacterium]|nr:S8 family serine peptidase [Verrucomicrobiota bacterium]
MKRMDMAIRVAVRGALGLALWLAGPGAEAWAAAGGPARGREALLVKFRGSALVEDVQRASADMGAHRARAYTLVPGLERWEVGAGQANGVLRQLLARADVEYAEPDFLVQTAAVIPNDPAFVNQWGLFSSTDADINGPEAWDVSVGDPAVVVAIIDTGVQWNHPDLAANIFVNAIELNGSPGIDDDGNGYVDDIHGWDFYAGDSDPMDESGHGTHVAGIVGAAGNNGMGVAGTQWRARILPLRFIGPNGGYVSDAIEAVEYAVAMGARISNNSWGSSSYSSALESAISKAGGKGHLFVAAAGNSGLDADKSPFYPACYPLDSIVSVAAVGQTLLRASFSNYGAQSVDLGAPGVSIYSTLRGSTYGSMSGTSMASPHVAGVAALVLATMPDASVATIRDRLFATVRPLASLQGVTVTGGMVDAAAAVAGIGGTAPATPGNLAAVTVTSASVSLAWTDNAQNESGFHLERSGDGAPFSTIATLGANTTGWTDSGVAAGQTYYYRVCAFNSFGESDYSNVATAVTPRTEPVPVAPGAPGNLAAKALAGKKIALTWTLGSGETTHLMLSRATKSDFKQSVLITLAPATSYTDSGLVAGKVYYYRLQAFNGTSASPYSNSASAKAIR